MLNYERKKTWKERLDHEAKRPKLWAIGDIHGEYDKLVNVLMQLFQTEKVDLSRDTIVCLGDYIDRGPRSRDVLKHLFELRSAHPDNFVMLAGNHEWLMLDALTIGHDYEWQWQINGGDDTLHSFKDHKHEIREVLKKLAALPLFYEDQGHFFSHAPQSEGTLIKEATKHDLIWNYSHNDDSFQIEDGETIGVCGHIHRLREGIFEPRFTKSYIFADAGCGCHRSAQLCAVEVHSRKIVRSSV